MLTTRVSKTWVVYMLRCRDGSLYTGITNNLDQRLKKHRMGSGSKYVWSRRPFNLVYSEESRSKSDALKREYEIKGKSKAEKELLITQEIQG